MTEFEETWVKVGGMSCASCAYSVEKEVNAVEGVEEVDVNFSTEKLSVKYNNKKTGLEDIGEAIERAGYTAEHGSINFYEETTDWTAGTFLTHIAGLVPDLRYGSDFHIQRYAADSRWAKLLFDWWRVIRPVWPVAPAEMRYFERDQRAAALEWVNHGDEP